MLYLAGDRVDLVAPVRHGATVSGWLGLPITLSLQKNLVFLIFRECSHPALSISLLSR